MASMYERSLLLSLPVAVCLAVLTTTPTFGRGSASSPQAASGLRASCASSAGQIASANPASPHTVQSVESYYSSRSGRCYVLLSRRPERIGKVLPTVTWRMLYDGFTGQVLARASDENGARTGRVLDPDYRRPAAENGDGFDAAVAYIKMALE
jgi:hypothetical protein